MHLDEHLSWFIARDEGATAMENAPPSAEVQHRRDVWMNAATREMSNAAGRAPGGIFIAFLLVMITAGCWLIWDFIRCGPNIVVLSVMDAHFLPAHRKLERSIESDPGCKEVLGITALYFFMIAVVVLLVAGELGIMVPPILRRQMMMVPGGLTF